MASLFHDSQYVRQVADGILAAKKVNYQEDFISTPVSM